MSQHTSMFKQTVIALVFLAMAATTTSAKAPKAIKVFFLGGQSNMVGLGAAVELKQPYDKPNPRIKVWSPTTTNWVTLSPEAVEGNKRRRFGPEVTFGHTMAKILPDEEIYLVKYAVSGTALYNDWDPKTKGPQYVAFMETTRSAIENLIASHTKYELSGMLWLQGESDAAENQADSYEENLTVFIAHIRQQYNVPSMPFIIARVRSHYGRKNGQAKVVRGAQVRIADADKAVGWFDTDDCSMYNAGHYNTDGILEIGKRFAQTYVQLIEKKNDE